MGSIWFILKELMLGLWWFSILIFGLFRVRLNLLDFIKLEVVIIVWGG